MGTAGGDPLPERPPHDTLPRWGEVGIHGVHRQRRWDALATARAPGLAAAEVTFVALEDGTLLVESGEEVAPDALAPLAEAIAERLERPFRVHAVRSGGDLWTVGATGLQVVRVAAGPAAEELVLARSGGERTVTLDGETTVGLPAELDRIANASRSEDLVLRARRLAGDLWEVELTPL